MTGVYLLHMDTIWYRCKLSIEVHLISHIWFLINNIFKTVETDNPILSYLHLSMVTASYLFPCMLQCIMVCLLDMFVTYWFLSGFCLLLCSSVSLLVSVSLAFCHVLALVIPSYVFVFMFTLDLSKHSQNLSHVSVTSGSDAVSVNLPSLLVFWFSLLPHLHNHYLSCVM